jgi:hypothetical protein
LQVVAATGEGLSPRRREGIGREVVAIDDSGMSLGDRCHEKGGTCQEEGSEGLEGCVHCVGRVGSVLVWVLVGWVSVFVLRVALLFLRGIACFLDATIHQLF